MTSYVDVGVKSVKDKKDHRGFGLQTTKGKFLSLSYCTITVNENLEDAAGIKTELQLVV